MNGKPNIIFILTDDQRADTLGCMGNPIVQTPNLDRLAAEGTLFANGYVTSAICTPSRACFFLGQYERRHGINFNSGTSMAPEAWSRSYPVLLQEAGYYTGYIGKNHVPIGEGGYDSGLMESSFDYWYAGHKHLKFYPKAIHPIFRNAKADTQAEILEEGVMNFLEPNEDFMSKADRFLEKRPANRPFCLSVCFNLPHNAGLSSMRMLPEDPDIYRTLYRDIQGELPLPPAYTAKAAIQQPKLPADVLLTQYRQTSYVYVDEPETMREWLVRVYQTVTGIDRFVGNMRRKLEQLGLADNTVLVFVSDHGIMFGEHGLGGKALNYEECLHVPFMIYDPRIPADRRDHRVEAFALSIDVAPTLLAMAGIQAPESMQGRDLSPLLRGEVQGWREDFMAENLWSTGFGNPRCETLRTKKWKYTRYFACRLSPAAYTDQDKYAATEEAVRQYEDSLFSPLRGERPVYEELYDLEADPREERNLAQAASGERAEVLEEMRKLLHRRVAEARGGDDLPLTIPIGPQRRQQIHREVPQD